MQRPTTPADTRIPTALPVVERARAVAEHQRAASGPPRVEGDRVAGPGTNTSLTSAAILAAAEAYLAAGLEPEHDLVFAAVAQEEGRPPQREPGHRPGGGRILSLPAAARTDEGRTRLNVAMLQSGAVFNHKPETGWFSAVMMGG